MSASDGRTSVVEVVRIVERRVGRGGMLWSLSEGGRGVEDMAASTGS